MSPVVAFKRDNLYFKSSVTAAPGCSRRSCCSIFHMIHQILSNFTCQISKHDLFCHPNLLLRKIWIQIIHVNIQMFNSRYCLQQVSSEYRVIIITQQSLQQCRYMVAGPRQCCVTRSGRNTAVCSRGAVVHAGLLQQHVAYCSGRDLTPSKIQWCQTFK